ncbi:SH3 domain-containing protein [Pseudanabaena sp. FACHB-2040]|uniref:SH3 domain-containing protein n=1 Tax=Pseudanabaena sp. FACHB-2040 TaxID=2692859 RepID=UPI001682E676|nr:SH3 domain-containing protein [Pseudanabaena sp. FACHB-2040]MBD2257539.1 SH3 domain-containing protein [Pseudanabaena sp. FACHB-2040]
MSAPLNSNAFVKLKTAWLIAIPAVIMLPLGSVLAATTAPPATSNLGRTELLLAQESITETVLYFETASRAVRIYRRGSDLFMNLYNRRTDVVEVNSTPAELVPSTRDQTVYKNSLGEVDRMARVTIRGEAELEIVAADGEVILSEPGSSTVVGVPSGETDFQGNNFAPGTGAIVLASRYANLRQSPNGGSNVITTVPRREFVDVLDRVGSLRDGFIWYQVLYNGQTGWVRGDLLQPT